MKAKLKAFGFMSGFLNVSTKSVALGRYHLPVTPVSVASGDLKGKFNPGDYKSRHITFEFREFDEDNCAIFELVDF